jgi:hypothetical protein
MALSLDPRPYGYNPQASFTGTFPSIGYESELTWVGNSSVIDITCKATVATTINIYQSPTQSDNDRKTIFSKTLDANEYFYKRFALKGLFYAVEVLNTNAVVGKLSLITAGVLHSQFAASTFLNSRISIDADTTLYRTGNDWNVDMVRGIHEDFTKVNIKGLLEDANPNTTRTIGLQNYNFVVDTATDLYILHPNANDDSAGTGARTVRIIYLDENDTIQTLEYTITGGGGSAFSLGVQGKAVHRVIVLTTGSLKENAGQITITNVSQTAIFATVSAGTNVSQSAIYLVPANQQLMLQDINIAGTGMSGKIRIIERNFASGINYSIGDFKINSVYQQLTYTINALITAGTVVMVNYIPDTTASALDTLINVNINGVLCPLVSNF